MPAVLARDDVLRGARFAVVVAERVAAGLEHNARRRDAGEPAGALATHRTDEEGGVA